MGFCMALSMNSVGIPGGFRGNAGFRENLGFGVVSGDLGGQKAFAQIAIPDSNTIMRPEMITQIIRKQLCKWKVIDTEYDRAKVPPHNGNDPRRPPVV